MASYKIVWKSSAQKELEKLPKAIISKVIKAVEQLSDTPYPQGVRKMVGVDQTFRLRIGDYRVVYNVFDNVLTIEIIRVKHRKDVYR
jgi:mRNA interferase RelE/StbE